MRVHRSLYGQRGAGREAEQEEGGAFPDRPGDGVTGLGAHDHPGAGDDRRGAGERRGVKRFALHAQRSADIERERREHLPGDEQPDAHQCSEAREEHDPGGDVQRGSEATGEMPWLGVVKQAERPERAGGRRQREQDHGAQAQLQRGGAERAADRGRELDVRGRLQREEAADEQQERYGEGLHGSHPGENLTVVKLF